MESKLDLQEEVSFVEKLGKLKNLKNCLTFYKWDFKMTF